MTKDTNAGITNQFLVFEIGSEEFGCNVGMVREVIRTQKVTRIPHCDTSISGVINYRGSLKPVVNLGIKLGLSPVEMSKESRFVVIDAEDGGYCFMVDRVTRTITVDSDAIEPPSALTSSHDAEYITGIAKTDTGLVLLVDPTLLAAELREESLGRASSY